MENIENLQIVKYSRPQAGQLTLPVTKSRKPDPDAHILAMWLLYCRAPKTAEPDATGAYSLGEIGTDALPDQRLLRDTPYSVCRGKREG